MKIQEFKECSKLNQLQFSRNTIDETENTEKPGKTN